MPDYRHLYAKMVCAASDALDALEPAPGTAAAANILRSALEEAEEEYVSEGGDDKTQAEP